MARGVGPIEIEQTQVICFSSEETTINANHYVGAGGGSGSIYMPAPHHYHVDYATHHELHQQQQLDGVAIPGRTVDQLQQQQQQQVYYQQQQQQLQAAAAAAASGRDLYPEPVQYHRHSPRHYIADQRPAGGAQLGTPTHPTSGVVVRQVGASSSNANTPLHRHSTSLGYPQDILDRRDYTSSSSRPIATSVVSNVSSVAGGDPPRHYNTHPRPLETRHRHVGSSQQSLRTSSSTHEIVQSEVAGGQNEHYIYVTYPPDLKKRYFDKYE